MAGTEKNCLLIVDDVEMNRAILSSIFEDEYKIIEAENGQEALKMLEQYGRADCRSPVGCGHACHERF